MEKRLLNPEKLADNFIIERRRDLPLISISIRFLSGSLKDPEEKLGLTRLTWLTALRSPKKVPYEKFHEALESRGINLSLSPGKETFELKISLLRDNLREGIEKVKLLLVDPGFREDNLDEVKRTTIASIRAIRDDLNSTLRELIRETALLPPYSHSSLGKEEIISELSLEEATAWYPKLISSNFSVSAVGDISSGELEDLARLREFISELGATPKPGSLPPAKFRAGARGEDKLNKLQAGIGVSFPAPPINDIKGSISFGVLQRILSSMSSRLFMELREKLSLAYSVGATYTPYFGTGLLTAYMTTAKDKKEFALEKLLEEMKRLKGKPPTKEEVERAKSYSKGTFLIGLQYRDSIATRYSYSSLLGLPLDRITKYLDLLGEVNERDIEELINSYLSHQPAISVVS